MKYAFLTLTMLTASFLFAQKAQKETVIYEDTLGMDLFIPMTKNANKPVLIYVHGGGFSGGERDLPEHLEFCERYASEGWVTATISYHLTMKGKSFSCDQAVQNKVSTIFEAAKNIHQSVAYLLGRKSELGIDSNKIVLVGSSAGAEAVMHAIYWEKTSEGILPVEFKYGGMVSMAGALLDQRWVTAETAVPSAFFHGTCDNLVPYANAPHHYCEADETGFMMLYGSYSIAEKLQEISKSYYLLTDCGGGHEWASKPIWEEHITHMDYFLNTMVRQDGFAQIHTIVQEGEGTCAYEEFGFCSSE